MTAMVLARHNAGIAFVIESLSVSGARLVGPLTLGMGERVQILFEIDERPVDVNAEVVRVTKQDLMTDSIAVRFVELSSDARESIRGLVLRTLEHEGDVDGHTD